VYTTPQINCNKCNKCQKYWLVQDALVYIIIFIYENDTFFLEFRVFILDGREVTLVLYTHTASGH